MAPRAYRWWYVDGLSDDGRQAVSVIAFVGSVFSSWYHWSGRGDPLNHAAINVAVYGATAKRWAMTERGRRAVSRERSAFAVGPSSLHWDGLALNIRVDEIGCPIPRRIRGSIRLVPLSIGRIAFALDGHGRHRWYPVAARARIEVDLEYPRVRWQGNGYLDSNDGDEPLEAGFERWDWCRADQGDCTAIVYDVFTAAGESRECAVEVADDGSITETEATRGPSLAPTPIWRVPRALRVDDGGSAKVLRTLEDTPFYARSVLAATIGGRQVTAMHESLSLARLKNPLVRAMLPFRMPRRP